jgi:hypothetical protein
MSASSHSFFEPLTPDVLGDLFHSLSQPLTSLRCSLELSLDPPRDLTIEKTVALQQENVAVALQQIEKVIGMIQLMREYLDADQIGPQVCTSAVAAALSSVVDELSSIAAVRGVRLRLVGACTATLLLPQARLKLALQYLIASMIDAQSAGGRVTLLLGEGPAGAVLRAEGEPNFREPNLRETGQTTASLEIQRAACTMPASVATLRRARLAIASRMLEGVGASLVFTGSGANPGGFVLRIAPPPSPFMTSA